MGDQRPVDVHDEAIADGDDRDAISIQVLLVDRIAQVVDRHSDAILLAYLTNAVTAFAIKIHNREIVVVSSAQLQSTGNVLVARLPRYIGRIDQLGEAQATRRRPYDDPARRTVGHN